MRNSMGAWPWAIFIIVLSFFAISCENISDNFKDIFGGEDESSIPEEAIDLAEGLFNVIGSAFDSDYTDPTDDPDLNTGGMSARWIEQDISLEIIFTDCTPPDSGNLVISGSITITKTSDDPLTITVAADIVLTNHAYSSVSMDGIAIWAQGSTDLSEESLESIEGVFVVDNKSYTLADIVAAMEDDSGGGDNDDIPSAMNPVPIEMRNKSFYLEKWRTADGEVGEWEAASVETMDFNDTGTGWGLSGGQLAGYAHWYSSGSIQMIDFYDINKTAKIYTFTVILYSETVLHLSGEWEGQQRELYFTTEYSPPIHLPGDYPLGPL